MILEELLDLNDEIQAINYFIVEEAEAAKSLQSEISKLPSFPGTELRKTIEELVAKAAKDLKDFATKAKPWASKRGYRTKIFDLILSNPEKIAKQLIRKYITAQKADPLMFSVKEILKNISLEL